MDHSLEKIDLIRERAGLSYSAARQLLTEAQGDVVEALVLSETGRQEEDNTRYGRMAGNLLEQVKKALVRSNRLRLRIKNEDRTVFEIPAALGLAGALLAPKLAAAGAVALLLARYRLELQRPEEAAFSESQQKDQ